MGLARAAVVTLLLLLAGCSGGPGVPADAAEARDEGLGLVLRAWVEETDEGVLLHGELANEGRIQLQYRAECGHPWNSTIRDSDGVVVRPFVRDPCPDFFYETLAPGQQIAFRQTWDLADHEPGVEEGEPVAPGTYTWTLEAGVVTPREVLLETMIDVQVPDAGPPGDAAVGFGGSADRIDRDHYVLDGAVYNTGDVPVVYNALCGTFDFHVENGSGVRMTAPQAHCQALDRTELPPGGTLDFYFEYDRTTLKNETPGAAPEGIYTWVVAFNVLEPEGLDATHRVDFAVLDRRGPDG